MNTLGRTALLVVLGLGAVTWIATAQGDLDERLRTLVDRGDYDAALDLIEEREAEGTTLTDETRWIRAQLETDPDRFDRLALELTDAATVDERAVTLARAREQFARGRYQTAAELLGPWTAPGQDPLDGEVLLWLGMAEQAAGQPGAAKRALRAVTPAMPTYGMARALLADLALRAGRFEEATEEARRALEADADVGSLALSVLERSARARGEDEDAEDFARRLRDEYPDSAEAGWVRETGTDGNDTGRAGPEHVLDDGREGFALQFGAFRDRSLALRLAERVESAVDEVRIELDRSDGDPMYRVVGGRYLTRVQAETAERRLEGEGWQVMILAPTRGGR